MKFAGIRALSALLTLFIVPFSWATNTTHDVVIVGAGSAGLYAAKNLIEDGYDVLIIEATGRIGGRVYSATMGDTRIDLGAEEHYGKKGNNPVWNAMRREYGRSIYVNGLPGAGSLLDGWRYVYLLDPVRRKSATVQTTRMSRWWMICTSWYWRPSNHPDPDHHPGRRCTH